MSKTNAVNDDERVLAELQRSLDGWREALENHRTAPPDAGFSSRLGALATAAKEQADAYRAAAAGFDWVPYSAGKPPYELQPDTGRRGPHELWQRFDDAVERLGAATEGSDMLDVASAYEELATAAAQLAEAVEREDRATGGRARTRARRSA
jgi:hypothetical protein